MSDKTPCINTTIINAIENIKEKNPSLGATLEEMYGAQYREMRERCQLVDNPRELGYRIVAFMETFYEEEVEPFT